MTTLGIDYGLKRIGLAISDGRLASPIGQVSDLQKVVHIANEHQVDQIIIGLPDPKNSIIKEFGNRLSELTGKPVQYWDETLTTKEANQHMVASGSSAKARPEKIDQNAATIILQSYLDDQKDGFVL